MSLTSKALKGINAVADNTVVKLTTGVIITTLAAKGLFRTIDEGLSPDLPIGEKAVPAILNFFNNVPGLKEHLPTVTEDKFTQLDGYVWPTMLGIGAVTFALLKGAQHILDKAHEKDSGHSIK